MPTKVIAKRKFLNPVKSSNNGSVKWELTVDKYESKGKEGVYIGGNFIIYDCRKGITLDLHSDSRSASGRKDYKESINKLRWLAEMANGCADTMEENWNEVVNNE